jgi:hypothetical protein
MVSENVWGKSMESCNVNASDKEYPELSFPELSFPELSLICLHGRHRLLAALEFLSPKDQWWIVDVYLDSRYIPSRKDPL